MAASARRLDTLQTKELAEGVEIHLRAAGPFLRMVAWAIDLLVTVVALLLFAFVIYLFTAIVNLGDGSFRVADGVMKLMYFAIWWFYPVFFEAGKKGATLGKRALGLRVVSESGTRITMGQAMIRNIVRNLEIVLPLLPLVAFFHPRFQRLGDLAAGTQVIYARNRVPHHQEGPPALNSVPVTVALSREEQAAILAFRDRSPRWSEARREELVEHIQVLTGRRGPGAVAQVLGMARWLDDGK